jgi:hypothetical protein
LLAAQNSGLAGELGVAVHQARTEGTTFHKDVKRRDRVNPIFSVSGIPEMDRRYDGTEPTTWSWSDAGEEKDIEYEDAVEEMAMWTIVCERERDDPIAYRELAEMTPRDVSTCKRRYDRYKE